MNTRASAVSSPAGNHKAAVLSATIALLLMAAAALLAWHFTPRQKLTSIIGKLDLETAVPRAFGEWEIDPSSMGGVVNPQQSALLDKLYSQILSRTYINGKGERIMLSVAYGDDQRDGLALHYPEVCYPAQGFQLISNTPTTLSVGSTQIPSRRLETKLGAQRYEPVTYWTMIGTKPTRGGIQKKITEIQYGMKGLIPDGLLFRLSSIDQESEHAFALQEQFARELFTSTRSEVAARLGGFKHEVQHPQ